MGSHAVVVIRSRARWVALARGHIEEADGNDA